MVIPGIFEVISREEIKLIGANFQEGWHMLDGENFTRWSRG
jgi:hypothetical protein